MAWRVCGTALRALSEPARSAAAPGATAARQVAAAGGSARADDVIFLIGAPGVGKGTQSQMLAESHGVGHVSAGDLLRQAVARGDAQGQQLHRIIQEGRIVPAHVRTFQCPSRAARASGGLQ